MDQQDFDALDRRILARAERLWQDAGSPEGGHDQYLENARELVAIEEVPLPTIDPDADPVIEEAALLRNLGEFPTLRDQGDEQAFPDIDPSDDDNDLIGSDGDSSNSGGGLPDVDLPERDLSESDLPDLPEKGDDVPSDGQGLDPALWPDPDTPPEDGLNHHVPPDLPPMPRRA